MTRFTFSVFLLMMTTAKSQYEIKLSDNNYADLDIKFTTSNYADLDIRFVDSEYTADFTVGFTTSKNKATVAVIKDNYSDIEVKITESNYADIDIRITNSSYADLDIMIKKSGIVDFLIYSEDYLDKNEIVVACLPLIKTLTKNLKIEKIVPYIKECGSIVKPIYETYVSDDFEGWDFDDKVYTLDNGLVINSNTYSYSYSYRPSVKLYFCDSWFASIEGSELVPINVYR